MKRYLVSALMLSLIASVAGAADHTASVAPASSQQAQTQTPTSGIDIGYIDPAVRVQDDAFTPGQLHKGKDNIMSRSGKYCF